MSTFDVARVLERLNLDATKKGRRFWGLCPNREHNDASPSWAMWSNDSKKKAGLHYCFSCKFHGNLPQLVAYVLRLTIPMRDDGSTDFSAAFEWLKGDVVAQPPPKPVVVTISPIKRAGFALPSEVCFAPLDEWPSIARRYVIAPPPKGRGVTPAQVERWGIGYAVDGDHLGGRIVLVVRDGNGRPTSYTGRAFDGSERRYSNPREREHADKAAIFGEEHWPHHAARAGSRIYAAEGAFKVLAVERALGAVPLGGLMGSNIHPRHLLKLSGFGEVVYLEDFGLAGKLAADKLEASLGRRLRFSRVMMSERKDADDLPTSELRRLLWAIETRN